MSEIDWKEKCRKVSEWDEPEFVAEMYTDSERFPVSYQQVYLHVEACDE